MNFTVRQIGLLLVALGVGIGLLLPFFLVLLPALGITEEIAKDPERLLPVVATKQWLFTVPGVVEVLAHACGAAGMIALLLLWNPRSALLVCATAGGLLWMAVDIAANGISLHAIPQLAVAHQGGDVTALGTFKTVTALVDAARLAGHFGGGLWVLGVSHHARTAGGIRPGIAIAGLVTGAVMAANLFLPPLLFVSFFTVPAWLVVFGIAVSRTRALY